MLHARLEVKQGARSSAQAGRSSVPAPHARPFRSRHRDALIILGLALAARLLVAALIANTFDEDEFVYLTLGRALAHGAVPYRDFAFFHPPGILVLIAGLNPLTAIWWPFARLVMVTIDAITAAMVWRIALQLYGRRAALAAGVVYALNPLVLIYAGRVSQEIPAAALCTMGILILVTRTSRRAAIMAGVLLAAAIWMKYSQVIFVPAYLLAAQKRRWATLGGCIAGLIGLFVPLIPFAEPFVRETIAWQFFDRTPMPVGMRVEVTLTFWLVLNVLAVLGVRCGNNPAWLVYAFSSGALFLLSASAYPHYFVAVAPFAAVLAGRLAADIQPNIGRYTFLLVLLAGAGLLTATVALERGPAPVLDSTFSNVAPALRLIDRLAPARTPILADRLEFAYLTRRTVVANYFWDDHNLATARSLEVRLPDSGLVVKSPAGDPLSFPSGFTRFLNRHEKRIRLGRTTIWWAAQCHSQSHCTTTNVAMHQSVPASRR